MCEKQESMPSLFHNIYVFEMTDKHRQLFWKSLELAPVDCTGKEQHLCKSIIMIILPNYCNESSSFN
ncbi:hypothetical protein NIES4073_28450 [Kalymmatonema gypsitolerans NIES-4073]|nr:hypothetical protein NIES4073_28450 [Scytonema sp. NIES-4073]